MTNTHNEAFIREFIDHYQALTCLWQIKSKDYSNKVVKRRAYLELVDIVKKHYPTEEVDINVVKKKIQGLRTVFKKEVKKIEDSKRSGAGTDEIYTPRLWYFDLLTFIRTQEMPRTGTSLISIQEDSNVLYQPESQATDSQQPSENTISPENMDAVHIEDDADPALRSSSMHLFPRRKRRLQPTPHNTDLVGLCHNIIAKFNRKPASGFAQYLDEKLEDMTKAQKGHCERVILEVVRAGLDEKLHATSCYEHAEQASPSTLTIEASSQTMQDADTPAKSQFCQLKTRSARC
ncbi:uncharacterized protein ACNLHF_006287 [Anomaloglossus baeobatrachus]|uniref:uncharacterized protein LOC142300775 n=1 Tax=Anomaloglossus baeobatrachus TaxID=238106 RepID=UPI003F4F4F83